ncbi:MAG: hypothetical protein L0956_03515 [Candidatus Mariimomonas ferrooxydans]
MTYRPDELRELIPLYLNKRLSEKERQEFEEALNKYPELRRELMEFSEIKDVYKNIADEIPPLSDNLYERIITNIKSKPAMMSVPKKKGFIGQIQDFLKGFYYSPRVSWGVSAVLLAVILLLAVALPREDKFMTLTSEYSVQGDGIRINVVFDKESKEKEIREVLTGAGATIIYGPSPEGLYTIYMKDNKDIETRLSALKNTKIVRFAEKAY